MHAIIITFDLVDLTPEQYTKVSAELAPSFAALPGLLTKVWLTDVGGTGRAGLYLFADAAAADAFLASALARNVAENPHFGALTVRRFGVDEAATTLTQPRITVIPVAVPS